MGGGGGGGGEGKGPAPGDYLDTALLFYYIDVSNITNRYATLTEDVDRLMEGIFGIAEEDGEDLDSDPEPLDDASRSENESPVSDDELKHKSI